MKFEIKGRKRMILAWICMIIVAGWLFLALFRPILPYEITNTDGLDPASDEFPAQLEVLANSKMFHHNSIELLTDGSAFYEAELEAIRDARHSILLEAYIFQTGEIGDRFNAALAERARAGAEVNAIIDAVGSMGTFETYFQQLHEEGGRVVFYHPVRWYTWDRYNNRTHREILIVDGEVGFVGGAGIADHWFKTQGDMPPWRDSMLLVRGEAVDGLKSVFVENWVEAAGEILVRGRKPASSHREASTPVMVVAGTPSAGGSTRNRIIFQTFIASAQKSLHITNPYFLPDKSISRELVRAKKRGVDVKIITSGFKTDQSFTRSASRRLYGDLLAEGVEIHEYERTMNHVKSMVVDDLWSICGTTNFDSRSFGLNDEVNLVVRSRELARDVDRDFESDLRHSRRVTLRDWENRSPWERLGEMFSGLLERQQ